MLIMHQMLSFHLALNAHSTPQVNQVTYFKVRALIKSLSPHLPLMPGTLLPPSLAFLI